MKILNDNFEPVAELDNFQSLIWHEKCFDVGVFELHLGYRLSNAKYLYDGRKRNTGVIEELYIDGKKYRYKGRFLKSLLANKVVSHTVDFKDKTAEQIVKSLVSEFGGQSISVEADKGLGEKITTQVTGENLLEYTDKLLETQELCAYIAYDFMSNTLIYKVYKGVDNTLNKPPLSKNYENINDFSYSKDLKNVRNFAYVAGEEKEGQIRKIVQVDLRLAKEEKREIWVDARDIRSTRNENGATIILSEAEYAEMLKARGVSKLSEYNIEETIDIDPKEDFEIGEKRTFKDGALMSEQRITEIITAEEENTIKRSAVFGLQKLTLSDKIKREVT